MLPASYFTKTSPIPRITRNPELLVILKSLPGQETLPTQRKTREKQNKTKQYTVVEFHQQESSGQIPYKELIIYLIFHQLEVPSETSLTTGQRFITIFYVLNILIFKCFKIFKYFKYFLSYKCILMISENQIPYKTYI